MKDSLDPIELHISTKETAGNLVVTPAGECDMATASALRSSLCRALNRWRRPVVVDLSELTFIDSSGLNALVAAYRRAVQLGCPFALADPPAQVAKVLAVTGLDSVFPIFDSVRAACAEGIRTYHATDLDLVRKAVRVEDHLVGPVHRTPRRSA